MLSQFGIEGSRATQYVIAFAIILALVLLFAWVLRRLTGGRLLLPGQDRGRSRQPRLGIVDIYDLDRQRQLILLRRDNVEHLLLVGGPNDVVVETNIVRVPGARLPAGPNEPVAERPEPVLEAPPRPQVEPPGRPSIETQLAAQLGAFVKRPSEESDAHEELAPVSSVSAPIPAPILPPQPEPLLKPTRIEPVASAAPVFPDIAPNAPEPQRRPEPPRPVSPPPPRPVPPAPPVQPDPVRPPVEPPAPDAAILSDMAKQLEQALKRPAQPVAPVPFLAPDPVVDVETERDEPVESSPSPTVAPFPVQPAAADRPAEEAKDHGSRPSGEPPKTAAPAPAPAVTPAAAPEPAKDVSDPFSVEEIEAEFARLLGRPGEKS
ncbi:flagellar biosynthetic protein FliO [Microvirga pudoricolor]|uniref:flagellar biosynthetic protein FliO n=1 Tax=Microvirga pudoricolor TaxID=2778729 RepID=UPI00194E6493|nr:flagellar biosynthetic protein FliO [Microvirga pudoricolor]MBM6594620.1 FliO/MopB family protein [Microvirga pudoricolor]